MDKTEKIANEIKENFASIPVPDQLDKVIGQGIQRGKMDREEARQSNRPKLQSFRRPVAAALGVLVLLGGLGNTSKTFAAAVEDIPVIGYIVKTLTFVNHEARGGQVRDGLNLEDMDIIEQEKAKSIVISFAMGAEAVDLASAYTITAYERPNVLAFSIAGIRMMDMTKDFEAIRQSPYVKDIYPIMTLDDSMVRFNLVLNPNVTYEVIEHGAPAKLEIKLREKKRVEEETLYTVRSYSYPAGESFAIMEEGLMHSNVEYRILKDREDAFVYEFGRFESQEKAQAYIEQVDLSIDLFIEPMEAYALPEAIFQFNE